MSKESKLREQILNSVADSKKSQLQPEETIREWLTHLAKSSRPSESQMQEMVRAKHRVKMSTKLNDWPARGPQKWLMEWQKLMGECKKWSPSLYEQWISNFNLVWGEVPGAKFMCSQMRIDHKRGNSRNWTVYQASQELLDAWNEKSIRNGIRQGGRQSMTKASFATEP